MIDSRLLKSEIVKNGYTQEEFCKKIGMAHSTFVRKMRNGIFKTNEAEKIATVLKLEEPAKIFFGKN